MNDHGVVTAYFHASVKSPNGPAGIGGVLRRGEATIHEIAEPVGERTVNEAEYLALMAVVRAAARRGIDRVNFYGSSDLVVRQVRGDYRAREPRLRALLVEVLSELDGIPDWSIGHIPAAENRHAQRLSRSVLMSRPWERGTGRQRWAARPSTGGTRSSSAGE